MLLQVGFRGRSLSFSSMSPETQFFFYQCAMYTKHILELNHNNKNTMGHNS